MRCFVIGGTGRLGAMLTDQLASRGHDVRVATRSPKRRMSLPAGASAVAFDLRAPSAAALRGVDRVFCIMPRGVALAVAEERALLAALASEDVSRVVLVTGLGVDRAPSSPLYRLEAAFAQSALAHAVLRPNYMMQNLCASPLCEAIAEEHEIALAAGDARVSYIDARDVAEVAARAMIDDAWPHGALDLTGGESVDYHQIAEAITRHLGVTIRYRSLTEDEARAELERSGTEHETIAARLGFASLTRRGAFAPVTDAVQRVLGRAPRTLDDFVREHVRCWT
jgi:uncharacterized protein YbjT (DUF2867 family)